MIKPKALKPGDTIGIVAPSSPTTEERIKGAKAQLEDLGFKVRLGPSCYSAYGYLAGKDALRAEDLNHMFADQEIDGIICLRGGYGAAKILNQVDFDLIRENPKVFVGYSDITALHIAMNQISNLVTFHGPMAASDMAENLEDFSKSQFLKAIMGLEPMGEILNPDKEPITSLVGGKVRGTILGGNLSLIAATIGTPFEIDTRGKILFLEEIGEEPYRVDRMLTQLALAGKLEDAVGFILGDWNDCEAKNKDESLSLMEVFDDIIVPYKKPTIFNLKAGHCTPKLTLPFGVEALLNADLGKLVIEEDPTV